MIHAVREVAGDVELSRGRNRPSDIDCRRLNLIRFWKTMCKIISCHPWTDTMLYIPDDILRSTRLRTGLGLGLLLPFKSTEIEQSVLFYYMPQQKTHL